MATLVTGLAASILGPIVQAGTELVGKILDYHIKYREQMTPEVRAHWDEIGIQIYWDWRDSWQALGIVGPPAVPKPGGSK